MTGVTDDELALLVTVLERVVVAAGPPIPKRVPRRGRGRSAPVTAGDPGADPTKGSS